MNINSLKVSDLKKVLKDYNTKLKKKMYKMNMKKQEIVQELNKMYKITDKKDKILFLRKGKQHSYVLHMIGSEKRTEQDSKDKAAKAKRKAVSDKKKKENFKKQIIKAEKDKRIRRKPVNKKSKKKNNDLEQMIYDMVDNTKL